MYTSYVDYKDSAFGRAVREAYRADSYFADLFGTGNRLLDYDAVRFPFRAEVQRLIREKGLVPGSVEMETLHQALRDEDRELSPTGQNPVAVSFYDVDSAFHDLYRRFIRDFLAAEVFREPLVFQAQPTFRFSFPGSAGFNWLPNYHTDIMLGHPPEEINVWLPMTLCSGSNSLGYMELEDSTRILEPYGFDLGRYASDLESPALQQACGQRIKYLTAKPGEVFLFDSRSLHVSPRNQTQSTRISLDFRVVPLSVYERMPLVYTGTGRMKSRFERGGYYAAATSADL